MTRPTHWIVRWERDSPWRSGSAIFTQRSAARRFAADKRAQGFTVTIEAKGF